VREFTGDCLQGAEPRAVQHRQRGTAGFQLMAQEAARQLGVEQNGDRSEPAKAEPDTHEIQTVGQQHCDHVAGLDTKTGKETSHTCSIRHGFTECQCVAVRHLDPATAGPRPGLLRQDLGQDPSPLISETRIHGSLSSPTKAGWTTAILPLASIFRTTLFLEDVLSTRVDGRHQDRQQQGRERHEHAAGRPGDEHPAVAIERSMARRRFSSSDGPVV
jgi:hypothetical protein